MTTPTPEPQPQPDTNLIVALYLAQTERLRVLLAFLNSGVCAPLDENGQYDPDVTAAYNVATEMTLKHITALIRRDHSV